jgi:hypothetical protein
MSDNTQWLHYRHPDKDTPLAKEEARRRKLNPYLGGMPKDLNEGVSGSAWMFYNHYNPDLLNAIQKVIVGEHVENIVNSLLEDKALCEGSCSQCLAGTCSVGKELNCPHQAAAEKAE